MAAILEKIKWTYERMLKELPPESRYELINNDLTMSPSPVYEHQRISGELGFLIRTFVK